MCPGSPQPWHVRPPPPFGHSRLCQGQQGLCNISAYYVSRVATIVARTASRTATLRAVAHLELSQQIPSRPSETHHVTILTAAETAAVAKAKMWWLLALSLSAPLPLAQTRNPHARRNHRRCRLDCGFPNPGLAVAGTNPQVVKGGGHHREGCEDGRTCRRCPSPAYAGPLARTPPRGCRSLRCSFPRGSAFIRGQ